MKVCTERTSAVWVHVDLASVRHQSSEFQLAHLFKAAGQRASRSCFHQRRLAAHDESAAATACAFQALQHDKRTCVGKSEQIVALPVVAHTQYLHCNATVKETIKLRNGKLGENAQCFNTLHT